MKTLIAIALLMLSMHASADNLVSIFTSHDGDTRIMFDAESFDGTGTTNYGRVIIYIDGKRTERYAAVRHDECKSGAGTLAVGVTKADTKLYAWSLLELQGGNGRGYDHLGVALCMLGGQISADGDDKPDNKQTNNKPKIRS